MAGDSTEDTDSDVGEIDYEGIPEDRKRKHKIIFDRLTHKIQKCFSILHPNVAKSKIQLPNCPSQWLTFQPKRNYSGQSQTIQQKNKLIEMLKWDISNKNENTRIIFPYLVTNEAKFQNPLATLTKKVISTKFKLDLSLMYMMDSCSDIHYVRQSLVDSLKRENPTLLVDLGKERLPLRTISGVHDTTYPVVAISLSFKSYTITEKFYVVPEISDAPLQCPCVAEVLKPFLDKAKRSHKETLHGGYIPNHSPDILLGNPHSLALATKGIIQLSHKSQPHNVLLFQTPIGNIPTGKIQLDKCSCEVDTNSPKPGFSAFTTNDSLSKALQALFKHENLDADAATAQSAVSSEDFVFLQAMKQTTFDKKAGRYVVPLPWKTGTPPEFYNNYNSVVMRFKALEAQIRKLGLSKAQIEELNRAVLEHIENKKYVPFENPDVAKEQKKDIHFLPFRMVVSLTSSSTRYRATLDGSAHSGLPGGRAAGPAVNEFLCIGPNTIPSQLKLHLLFRLKKISLTSDLSRFFLSIGVKDSDTRFTNFLYRPFCSDEPIKPYCIKVISWGLAPSVSQCSYVIRQHAQQFLDDPKASEGLKMAAQLVQNQLYCDNLLLGCDTVEEGVQLYKDIENLFLKGGFRAAKWTSSSPSVMKAIPEDKKCKDNLLDLPTPEGKVVSMTSRQRILGETLDMVKDVYLCGGFADLVKEFNPKGGVTKRILASYLAKVSFSHLNLKTAITIHCKKLLQEVCIYEQLNPTLYEHLKPKERWDKPLPKEFLDKFQKWLKELPLLDNLSFPRYVFNSPNYSIIAFCDAGATSVCSLLYLRAWNDQVKRYESNLLACRIKILPLQTVLKAETQGPAISVPRAELWAISIAAAMCEEVMTILNLTSADFTIFTDSQVCLSWVRLSSDRLSDWHLRKLSVLKTHKFKVSYVNTLQNPSDVGSKPGATVKDLQSRLFRHGPEWLTQPKQCWPQNPPEFDLTSESYISGLKRSTIDINYKAHKTFLAKTNHLFKDPFTILDGFYVARTNDFIKLKQDLGRLLRLPVRAKYQILKKKEDSIPELNLTLDSENEAFYFLIRFHQAKEFKDEYKHLLKQEILEEKTPLDPKSSLRPLRPKLVRKGFFKIPLIVTTGRLQKEGQESQLFIVTAGHLSHDKRHLNDTSANLIWNIGRALHTGANFSQIHCPHLTLVHELRNYNLHVIRDKFFAKQIVADCVPCGKHSSRAARLQVQPLPRALADPIIRDGLNEGVLNTMTQIALDRLGPLLIQAHNPFATKIRTRNTDQHKTKKVWVNLFLDLVSGFLNFEISPSLNTTDICLALDSHSHKFGSPETLYMDQEKAFKKMGSKLDEIFDQETWIKDLTNQVQAKGIKTRFSFPLNPSQNGKIEHLVGVVKKSLEKVYKNKIFSFYELHHSLVAACGMVNSRPLAYLNGDTDTNIFHPSQILTPKSIIFGRNIYQHDLPFQTVAENPDIAEIWAKRRKIVRDFSEAFLKFYLPESDQSKAFNTETDNLQVGDLVLAPKQLSDKERKESKTLTGSGGPQSYASKSLWPVGRIEKLMKSAKGVNVAAQIRLGDATYTKGKAGKFKLLRPGTVITRSVRSLRIVKALKNLTSYIPLKDSKGKEIEKIQMTDIYPQNAKQSPIIPLAGKVLEENPTLKLRSGRLVEKKVFWSHTIPDKTTTLLHAKECFIHNEVPAKHCCD